MTYVRDPVAGWRFVLACACLVAWVALFPDALSLPSALAWLAALRLRLRRTNPYHVDCPADARD